MRVVTPARTERFVALSYMWQANSPNTYPELRTSNLEGLENYDGLKLGNLPNIVSDAISLCQYLDERYLWIDRFCIIQDDASSKHGQICAMDRIYNSAAFTIIAAVNDRNDTGLPGYRGRPRSAQHLLGPARKCEVEGHGIRPDAAQTIVNPSLWNRRGWTFQERILSRRRLFVTEFQVMFECSCGIAYEELTYLPHWAPPHTPSELSESSAHSEENAERDRLATIASQHQKIPGFVLPGWNESRQQSYNLKDNSSLATYFDLVGDYTTRQLSYSSDILNAFTGVGNAIARLLKTQMIVGLPERYLPQALMWSSVDPLQRRTGMDWIIPTWSWASHITFSEYYWINGTSSFKDDLEKIVSLVYFHYSDPTTGRLRKL